MKLHSFEPLERNHQDQRGLKWKYYTVLRMCSLSSFARKGSKRCRWGDIRFGHDESSHSAPWRPLGMGVMGVDPLMIGRQEDRYIHPLPKVLKMKHESVQNEPQHFPFVLTFLHSSRICYLNLTQFFSLQSLFHKSWGAGVSTVFLRRFSVAPSEEATIN